MKLHTICSYFKKSHQFLGYGEWSLIQMVQCNSSEIDDDDQTRDKELLIPGDHRFHHHEVGFFYVFGFMEIRGVTTRSHDQHSTPQLVIIQQREMRTNVPSQ